MDAKQVPINVLRREARSAFARRLDGFRRGPGGGFAAALASAAVPGLVSADATGFSQALGVVGPSVLRLIGVTPLPTLAVLFVDASVAKLFGVADTIVGGLALLASGAWDLTLFMFWGTVAYGMVLLYINHRWAGLPPDVERRSRQPGGSRWLALYAAKTTVRGR